MGTKATFKVRGIFQTIDIGFICKSKSDERIAEKKALKIFSERGWDKLTLSEIKFKGVFVAAFEEDQDDFNKKQNKL